MNSKVNTRPLEIKIEREKCEREHLFFTRRFFMPRMGFKFSVNWHHEYIAWAIDEVIAGRIENLVINQPVAQPAATEFGNFLCFETVTLCPIDTRLVDTSLMNAEEIAWLNEYHAQVREKLLPLVDGAAKTWLEERTIAIS